ncbi:MAG: transposase [Planctomycetota bacterium]|nr:transposase [Planctomycetota bacterium]MDA1214913.1 transposase [Planctomycetota bacterium]
MSGIIRRPEGYETACKHRMPWISNEVSRRLYAYQQGIFQELESPAIVIGGVEDHVHALFTLSKNYALKTIVEEVKKSSSKWMKSEGTMNPDFYWQSGYAAFSVSQSNKDRVKLYIDNQKEHHRKISFQDEIRTLCRRHGFEIDERYMWD